MLISKFVSVRISVINVTVEGIVFVLVHYCVTNVNFASILGLCLLRGMTSTLKIEVPCNVVRGALTPERHRDGHVCPILVMLEVP